MSWSSHQRQLAARAWRQTGQDDDMRKLLLRQFSRAMFDDQGTPAAEPSSKSARLTQTDFEDYMAHVEGIVGGQLKGFAPGYWQEQFAKEGGRLAWKIQDIASRLEGAGLLARGGVGLRGWIARNFDGLEKLDQLTAEQLVKVYEGLKAYARKKGVRTQT